MQKVIYDGHVAVILSSSKSVPWGSYGYHSFFDPEIVTRVIEHPGEPIIIPYEPYGGKEYKFYLRVEWIPLDTPWVVKEYYGIEAVKFVDNCFNIGSGEVGTRIACEEACRQQIHKQRFKDVLLQVYSINTNRRNMWKKKFRKVLMELTE